MRTLLVRHLWSNHYRHPLGFLEPQFALLGSFYAAQTIAEDRTAPGTSCSAANPSFVKHFGSSFLIPALWRLGNES